MASDREMFLTWIHVLSDRLFYLTTDRSSERSFRQASLRLGLPMRAWSVDMLPMSSMMARRSLRFCMIISALVHLHQFFQSLRLNASLG
jgi:hypothetical protein